MPTQTDNEQDSKDIVDNAYHDMFDSNSHAVADDLASLEADLDQKYSQDFDALDDKDEDPDIKGQEEAADDIHTNDEDEKSVLKPDGKKSRLKRMGPTGSIIGIILALMGVGGVITGPASLLVMLDKTLTNNGTFDVRANSLLMKARYGALFGSDRNCATSKIKCKVKSMSKAEVERLKMIPGVTVHEGESFFKRSIITGIDVTDPDGNKTEIRNAKEYAAAMKDKPYVARTLWRINNPKAAFFIDQQAKMRNILKKYKLSLGKVFKVSTKKNKAERTAENNKNMDEHTGAATAEEGGGSPDGKTTTAEEEEKERNRLLQAKDDALRKIEEKWTAAKEKTAALRASLDQAKTNVKAQYDKLLGAVHEKTIGRVNRAATATKEKIRAATIDRITAKLDPKLKTLAEKMSGKLKGASSAAGGAGSVVALLCAAKSTISGAVAIVKLEYYSELIRFAFPFIQAGAQIIDQGSIKPETSEYIGDRLTSYDNQEKLDNGSDNPKYGLTATDSQGFQAAMYGDFGKLKEFTQQYTPWYAVAAIQGQGILGAAENLIGTENIQKACFAGKTASLAGFVGCATPGGAFMCAAGAIAMFAFSDDIMEFITGQITKEAIKRIADADLNSGLAGVDLGNAIAAGVGLMLMEKSRASGLMPATSVTAVKAYAAQTQDSYDEYIAGIKDEAKNNPFDTSNQYSFAGRLIGTINPYKSGQTTGSSFVTNILGILTKSSSLLASPAGATGYYQPIESIKRDGSLESMESITSNPESRTCQDAQMKELGALCDLFGRSIDIMPQENVTLAKIMMGGSSEPWDTVVDWMQNNGKKDPNDPNADGYLMHDGSGKPRDYDQYPTSIDPENYEEKDYENEYLMYKAYCTEDRVYPLGTTTWSGDDADSISESNGERMAWHNGNACVGQDGEGKESSAMKQKIYNFSFYYAMCETQLGIADGNQKCWEDEPADGGTTTDTPKDGEKGCGDGNLDGDAKALAQKVLNCKNLQFQGGKGGGAYNDIKAIADTGKDTCSHQDVDTALLKYVLYGANRFKITLGVSAQSHGCDGGPHSRGMAIDINGIQPLDKDFQNCFGSCGNSPWSASDEPNIKSFEEYIGSYAKPGRLEFGQSTCWTTATPPTLPGQASGGQFSDACNHLHMDSTNYWITNKWPSEINL